MRDLNGMVESLVLVVLIELGGETFILIVLLSQKLSKVAAFFIVLTLINLLLKLFTWVGDTYVK